MKDKVIFVIARLKRSIKDEERSLIIFLWKKDKSLSQKESLLIGKIDFPEK